MCLQNDTLLRMSLGQLKRWRVDFVGEPVNDGDFIPRVMLIGVLGSPVQQQAISLRQGYKAWLRQT